MKNIILLAITILYVSTINVMAQEKFFNTGDTIGFENMLLKDKKLNHGGNKVTGYIISMIITDYVKNIARLKDKFIIIQNSEKFTIYLKDRSIDSLIKTNLFRENESLAKYHNIAKIKLESFSLDEDYASKRILCWTQEDMDAINVFLLKEGFADEKAVALYNKKVAFLQKKIMLNDTGIAYKSNGKALFNYYKCDDNLQIQQIVFNNNQHEALLTFQFMGRNECYYVKIINGNWRIIDKWYTSQS